MRDDERDDEKTQAMPTTSDDDTQLIADDDEATHVMPSDDATQTLAAEEATRRIDTPPAADPPATQRITQRHSAAPDPTDRIAVAEQTSSAVWLTVLAIAAALLIGGVIGYTQRKPGEANVVARALVGAQGGVVTFDGDGKLTVPENALPTATAITVRKETIDHRIRLGPEADPQSVTYEAGELTVYVFEPTTLRFQQPVTIELPRRVDGTAVLIDTKGGARVVSGEGTAKSVKLKTTSFSFDDL